MKLALALIAALTLAAVLNVPTDAGSQPDRHPTPTRGSGWCC